MSEVPLPQALDFKDESLRLYALLEGLNDRQLQQQTLFKGWTFDDIITHLHLWNWAAALSLEGDDAFANFHAKVEASMTPGKSLRDIEPALIGHLRGQELVQEWRSYLLSMAERFAQTDPKRRLKWAGPDMSARTSISARLMETWSHGQAIYDALGRERMDTDSIRNIAVLGMNTFGYCHRVHGLDIPEQKPHVALTAPSGAQWTWGDASDKESIRGTATHFCQVVTQTRNVADTTLEVRGCTAKQWMCIAQCFAGAAETPPPAGYRRKAEA